MSLSIEATSSKRYKGPTDQAPDWVRKMVASWPRRLLMWPLTVYSVVFIGIVLVPQLEFGFNHEWIELLCSVPSYGLLMVMAVHLQQTWYTTLYQDKVKSLNAEETNKTTEQKRTNRKRSKKDTQ